MNNSASFPLSVGAGAESVFERIKDVADTGVEHPFDRMPDRVRPRAGSRVDLAPIISHARSLPARLPSEGRPSGRSFQTEHAF
ncbi:MAG: hypothetical protein ACRDGL_11435 [Candidatus Limnocylindrales bacterium]